MITCQHAQQLFDRYLDGELSASLQTELHAHRLSCSACQNELALVEACGDVIAMDRCEPQVNRSFTDRVILAQRGRRPAPRRRWGRWVLYLGSPMAAAASVAFAVFLMTPRARTTPNTVIAGASESAPREFRAPVSPKTTDALIALENTPEMNRSSFVDSMLAPFVERSKNTIEGTRRGVEELQLLMQSGFSRMNESLIARGRADQQSKSAHDIPGRSDPALFNPAWPGPPIDADSPPSPQNDDPLEPL